MSVADDMDRILILLLEKNKGVVLATIMRALREDRNKNGDLWYEFRKLVKDALADK